MFKQLDRQKTFEWIGDLIEIRNRYTESAAYPYSQVSTQAARVLSEVQVLHNLFTLMERGDDDE